MPISKYRIGSHVELGTGNSHGRGSTSIVRVAGALSLVKEGLRGRLLVVRLGTTGKAIGGVGEGLLDLLLGGLGRIRSEFLLGLCVVKTTVSKVLWLC